MSAELEGGRVGGTSFVVAVVVVVVVVMGCCAGASAGAGLGFSSMEPKGSKSKGSRDGSSGSAFEKRDCPGVGGARDDGSSMMGEIPRFP